MKKIVHVMLLCIALYIMPLYAWAQEITVESVEDDGTYHYQYGSGSFETNIVDGGTYELAYVSHSSELQVSIIKDGSSYAFKNGDVLYESGSYVMMVYDEENGEYTSMTFFIENTMPDMSNAFATDDSYNDNQDSTLTDSISSEYLNDDMANDLDDAASMMDISSLMSSVDLENIEIRSMDAGYAVDYGSLLYSASGKGILYSSVPNGSVVCGSVVVSPTGGASQYTYKDGEVIVTPAGNIYTEPGFYEIVSIVSVDADYDTLTADAAQSQAYMYETKFDFTILGEDASCRLGVFMVPDGFEYVSISFDDKPQELPDSPYYYMENDGHYHIVVAGKFDKSVTFEYDYVKDTVAPFISFNQDIFDGRGEAPVSYSCSEPGVNIRTLIGGTEVNYAPNTDAYNSGYYRFIVTDSAGNQREYSFYVKKHYQFFSKGMLMLLGAVVVLMVIYFFMVRHGEYQVNQVRKEE